MVFTVLFVICFMSGCIDEKHKGSFIVENLLSEGVKVTGYYIPFDYPTSAIESGVYTFTPMETALLFESSYTESDGRPSSFNALRVFLDIQGVDSLVFEFEDSSVLSFKSMDITDPKNPINPPSANITGWSTTEIDKNEYEYRFKISKSLKEAAN